MIATSTKSNGGSRSWLGLALGVVGFGIGFTSVDRVAGSHRTGGESVQSLPEGRGKRAVPSRERPDVAGGISGRAVSNPEDFLGRMASLQGVSRPGAIVDLVGEARTNVDFQRLLGILDKLEGQERLAAITLLFHKWALFDPLAAFEVLDAPTARYGGYGEYRPAAYFAVMRQLAKKDARLAARIMSDGALSNFGVRTDVIKEVGKAYGALDLDEAVEWAFGFGENDVGGAFAGILEGLLERDADAGLALLEANKGRLVRDYDRASQFIMVGRALALEDWDKALRYYERLRDEPAGEERGKSFVWQAESGGVMAIAELDLQEGLSRFEEISREGRKEASPRLASYYAKRDPDGAAAWVEGLQEPEVYAEAMRALDRERSRRGRGAASNSANE